MEHISQVAQLIEIKSSEISTLQTIPNTSTKLSGRSNITGLPKLFLDKGFSNFDAYNDFLKTTKQGCIDFYMDRTDKKSLVLCGSVGTGKTHLAISILKNLPELPSVVNGTRKQNAFFMVADEFFMILNDASFLHKSKLDIIKGYLDKNDFFCLDDLGTYNMTPAKIENLYTFINYAYLEQKRIIITTNLLIKDFDQHDKRIGSRLQEMAHIIPFTEKDFRKK